MDRHENATAPAGPPAYEPPTTLNVVPFRVDAAATGALIPPTYEVAMGQEEPTAAAAAPAVNTRCTALTHRGEQCSRLSVDGSEYCGQHQRIFSDPARQEQWLRRQQELMERRAAAARRQRIQERYREMERTAAEQNQYAEERRAEAARRARERFDSPEQRRLDRLHRQQQREQEEEIRRAELRAKQKKWKKKPWIVRMFTTSPEKRQRKEQKLQERVDGLIELRKRARANRRRRGSQEFSPPLGHRQPVV